jgi:hypothetical protein
MKLEGFKADEFSNDSFSNDEFKSEVFKVGGFSFDHEEAELGRHVKEQVRKACMQASNSKLACIVEKVGAAYTVRTSDGFDLEGVISQDITEWEPGMWVTIEQTIQGWTIVGMGAFDGGDLPDQAG